MSKQHSIRRLRRLQIETQNAEVIDVIGSSRRTDVNETHRGGTEKERNEEQTIDRLLLRTMVENLLTVCRERVTNSITVRVLHCLQYTVEQQQEGCSAYKRVLV